MVCFFWIFITIKNNFSCTSLYARRPARCWNIHFNETRRERERKKMLLCLSEAKKGSWSKCREGTESTVKEVMGAHMRRRTTCSVRPSICLKLLSLTDCINKERKNKRGLSVYIAQLPRCWYTNKPLSSFFLKVYNFPAACSWCRRTQNSVNLQFTHSEIKKKCSDKLSCIW